jgi:hypothetical protein
VTEAPFPFVVGVARSGTTVLRDMLDLHPDLAVVDESYFITRVYRSRHRYVRDGRLDVDLLVEGLEREPQYERFRAVWGPGMELVRSRLAATPSREYPELVRCLYRLYAELQGKPRYGDKTPWYVHDVEILADLLPEARFVHIIRDGHNVALSLKEVHFGPRRLAVAADTWSMLVARGLAAGRSLGPRRYLEVRYEDLVEDAEPALRSVCELFELDFRPEMLTPLGSFREEPPDHARRRSYDTTTWLRDWRREMSRRQVEVVESVAGQRLAELGYPVLYPGRRATSRVAAWLSVTPHRVRRRAGRWRFFLRQLRRAGRRRLSRLRGAAGRLRLRARAAAGRALERFRGS